MPKNMQNLMEKYVNEIKKIYGLHLRQIILYGSYARGDFKPDSDVDIMTAKNTSMDCICVSWGFRSREFLLDHGAVPEQIAANVNELKALLEG